MHDVHTHLALTRAAGRERTEQAAAQTRAARVARLRRLDRQAEQAASRARLVRLALG